MGVLDWGLDIWLPMGALFINSVLEDNFNAIPTWITIVSYLIFVLLLAVRWLFDRDILGAGTQKMSLEESATILRGMIKINNQIDIEELSNITGEDPQFWKSRIYGLAGKDDIEGSFNGSIFELKDESDLDQFIDSLLGKFDEMDQARVAKLE